MAKKKVRKVTAALAEKAPKKAAAKKKTTTKKPTRKKAATIARKRLLWGVFSSSMKEEGRFPYDQRKEAEKKLEQLNSKSKKPYFIQPIKEVLSEGNAKAKKPVADEVELIPDEAVLSDDAVLSDEEE